MIGMVDPLIAFVLLSVLLAVPIWLLFFHRSRKSLVDLPPQDAPEAVLAQSTTLRHAGAGRMRRRNMDAASSSTAGQNNIEYEVQEEDAHKPANYATKSSKKKEMRQREKEVRRQAEEASRDLKMKKQDRYAEIRRRKDEEREAEELRREEETRLQRMIEEAAASAEFEKWKDSFTVDTEGNDEADLGEASRSLLNEFMEYIKKHKCVQLEDLAAEFHLRTQDAIDRITSLEKSGHLSGVMDDRGKYIYISIEEMKAVAEYIKARGRVSIAHLASKSNEFIDLNPKYETEREDASSLMSLNLQPTIVVM